MKSKAAEDLPGLGRFYCIECAKWFESENNLVHHKRGKVHKRRCLSVYFSPTSSTKPDQVTIVERGTIYAERGGSGNWPPNR